jgi:hypothetical protein
MLNLLTKTKPWMVASLLVAASVFAQDNAKCAPKDSCKPCPKPCPQPNPPTQLCPAPQSPCCPPWPVPVLNAAYNYPARITTRCPWDVSFDASFIYWQPIQENMELGVNVNAGSDTVINMDFDYKPGFKVGLGGNFDYDNWDIRAGYTWFHNTNSTAFVAAEGTIASLYGNPTALAEEGFSAVGQKWRLRMDIAELVLGRWNYVGTKLTVRPNIGARGAWIRQNLTAEFGADGVIVDTIAAKSTSWAVGPQIGLDANWNLGEGFRFFGNAEGDILYTRYNNLSTAHTDDAGEVNTVSQRKYGTLRTHLDLELGFGWGTYLDCNNWYMDFALGYGFQVFFDQNMFRRFTQVESYNSISPNGNLYVQGLTVTFKLDF